MSTTTSTTTLVGTQKPSTLLVGQLGGYMSTAGCPNCGFEDVSLHQQSEGFQKKQIKELETQIKVITEKAAASAEKVADYEDEIRFLRSQSHSEQSCPTNQSSPPKGLLQPPPTFESRPQESQPSSPQPQPQPQQQTRFATIASYLPYGKRTNNPPSHHQSTSSGSLPFSSPGSSTSSPPSSTDAISVATHSSHQKSNSLQKALNREQTLRKDAESRLNEAHSELEDLTAQLFSQANEMVAQERKARAKLEERVEFLEQRDVEKRGKLELLEKAVERVGRVRQMVGG